VKHRLAGHGGWQTGGVEPVAEVPAGDRAGERGRYGIDGGFAGLAVFGVIEAGLAGTVAWSARHRRRAIAVLAAVGGAVVAGSATSYLYSTGPGKRAAFQANIRSRVVTAGSRAGPQVAADLYCGDPLDEICCCTPGR